MYIIICFNFVKLLVRIVNILIYFLRLFLIISGLAENKDLNTCMKREIWAFFYKNSNAHLTGPLSFDLQFITGSTRTRGCPSALTSSGCNYDITFDAWLVYWNKRIIFYFIEKQLCFLMFLYRTWMLGIPRYWFWLL